MGKINYSKTTAYLLATQYIQIILTVVYGIVLIPLYLTYISAEMYGVWLATGNMMMWFSILMPEWSQLLLQQLGVTSGAKNKKAFSRTLTSGIIISVIFAFTFFAACWGITHFFPTVLDLPNNLDLQTLIDAFLLASAGTAVTAIGSTYSASNLALHYTLIAGLINIVSMLMRIGVVVIMLFMGYGVYALGYGGLAYGLTMFIFNFVVATYKISFLGLKIQFCFRDVLRLARLAVFSSVDKFGNILAKQIDYFLVTSYLGGESSTVLRLVKAVPETLLLFATNVSYALMPAISHMKGAGAISRKIESIMRVSGFMFAFSCLLGGGVYAFQQPFIGLWIDDNMFAGQTVVLLVVISLVLAGTADTFARYVFTIGKIKTVSAIRFSYSVLHIVLMSFGVKYWGITGMLLASSFVFGISSITFSVLLVQIEKIPKYLYMIPLREFFIGSIAAVLSAVFGRWLAPSSWLELIVAGLLFSTVFLIILFLLSANTRQLNRQVYRMLKRKVIVQLPL